MKIGDIVHFTGWRRDIYHPGKNEFVRNRRVIITEIVANVYTVRFLDTHEMEHCEKYLLRRIE